MTNTTTIVARGRVVFDPAWCRTCKVCEVACSILKEGQARPALARLRILFDEFAASDPITGRLCAHCADAPCLAACPNQAMTRDGAHRRVLFIAETAPVCMKCRAACPCRTPVRHPEAKSRSSAIMYDRAEVPLCLAVCPLTGKALRYETTD
jgi:Fe-S-cluster-containing hydrogenase component 2